MTLIIDNNGWAKFRNEKKKKRGRAGPARVFESRLDWLHFTHRCCDADRIFFPLLAKAFWNFSWFGVYAQPNLYTERCFRRRLPFRVYTLSPAVLPFFSYFLTLYLFLSLFFSVSVFTSHRCNFLFTMYPPVFQASEWIRSIRIPSCSENQ